MTLPPAEQRQRDRRQARLERYSRAVRWMKVALPVGAILLIGLIFLAGRERATVFDAESMADMAVIGSGLRLDNPRFAGVTEDGDPFVVTADWALPDGAMPDRVDLEKPAGELRLGDGTVVTVNAETGELRRGAEKLHLRGDVVLVTSDGHRVTTPRIELDLDEKTASAPERLRAEAPRGSIEADRVRVVRGEAPGEVTMRFEGDVRVRWDPEAPAGGAGGEPAGAADGNGTAAAGR